MEKKRAVGVTIFGIYAIFVSIVILFTFFKIRKSFDYLIDTHIFSKELLEYTIISSPILSFLSLISGIGILKLKSWGKNILIGLAVYNLLGKFIMIYVGISQKTPAGRPISVVLYFIVYGYIIYFFTRPNVKEQFK